MKMNRIGVWASAGVLALALVGCVNREAQKQAKDVEAIVTDPATLVTTMGVQSASVDQVLELTGQIVTDDDVSVSVKAPGRLSAVYVQEGSIVKAGQVIAVQEGREAYARLSQASANLSSARATLRQTEIDARHAPERSSAAVRASESRVRQAKAALSKALAGARTEEKAQAKANVDRAKSDLDLAKRNLERSKRLEKEGAISTAQLEADQNRYDNAQAAYTNAVEQYNIILEATRPEDVAQAREAVRQAEEQLKVDKANQKLDPVAQERVNGARAQVQAAQEAVELARIAVDDLSVRAPMGGKVSGKPLQAGTLVSPGVAVARLIGTGGVFFQAEVAETEVSNISPGMAVDASIASLGDVMFSGQVVSVSPIASNLGRLYTVRVAINESLGKVKPGMFVNSQVVIGRNEDVFVIPASTIIRDGDQNYVFTTATEDGKLVAKKRDIKLIRSQGSDSIVDGLNDGDQLVVKGHTTLVDGALIRLEEEKPVDESPANTEKGE